MKRFLTLLLMVLAVLCALSGCGGEGGELSRIGKALGLDLSDGTLVRYEDDHGGFHGDGETVAEVAVGGLEEELGDAPGWKPLPMSENAAKAVRLCGGEGAAVEQGFYYLYDRHRESENPYDDGQLHSRYSWNFTAAVYDTGAGRLYYYEFDT